MSKSSRRRRADAPPRLDDAPLPDWIQGKKNKQAARFILVNAWIDFCLGVDPDPDRWPYSDFNREAVEKLLAWAQFSPVASATPPKGEPAEHCTRDYFCCNRGRNSCRGVQGGEQYAAHWELW